MKQKLLEALKTKYKNLGFGEKAFDGVAEFLSKTVTEESQIETAVGGVDGLLKSFQGDVDVVRAEKSELQKQLEALTKKPEDKPVDDTPAWAKSILESNKTLADKVSTFEAEKLRQERGVLIASKAKEFGIPESIASKLNLAEDADIDAYMQDLKQDFVNSGFPINPPTKGDDDIKSDEDAIAGLINKGTESIVKQNQN